MQSTLSKKHISPSTAASRQLRSKGNKSYPPPGNPLQASPKDATKRNGNSQDDLNDALTPDYVAHANDPELWEYDGGEFHEYGPLVTGPVFHQGEGDAHEVAANDINQGEIGNCYFLAALAGVAEQRPELIKNAIEGPLADGTYNVRLFSSTSWDESEKNRPVTVNVSPSFVVYGNLENHAFPEHAAQFDGRNAYARDSDRDEQGNMELWVKLIEKAQAQLYGGWEMVDGGRGGWPSLAIEVLTGEPYAEHYFNGLPEHLESLKLESFTRPSSRLDAISEDELKATIIGHLQNKDIVTAETHDHALTVIDADENSITIRDPARAFQTETGLVEYTWAEFRANFMKYTSRRPD